MTIKLYIKTHNKTGLKYFGHTSNKNVHKYKGSGKYWKRHINKHGYDVTTTVLKEFNEGDSKLSEYALLFSDIYNIVESKAWANLTRETGSDGNDSSSVSGIRNPMYGKHHSIESIEKNRISNSGSNHWNFGGIHNKNTKEKMSKSWNNRELISCPYCKIKSKSASIMNQYHFKNCKNYKIIQLYNNNNILEFEGNFTEIYEKFKINKYQIETSIKNNKRMFISKNPGQIGLYKKRNVYMYRNWFAVYIN